MKYIVIIPDGGADRPMAALGGRTALEAARTPNLDKLARMGRLGRARTTPEGFEAGSDVCSMCLLGSDPAVSHTGRAPLEALALGLELGPNDWIFRLNFVTTGAGTAGPFHAEDSGVMVDHSAGALSDAEGRALVDALRAHWAAQLPRESKDLTLTPGVSYRNILVDAGAGQTSERRYDRVRTTPPHAIPGEAWRNHLPKPAEGDAASAAGASLIEQLMLGSRQVLENHPVNRARRASGKRPATMAWIWGQGVKPTMQPFAAKYGLRGTMITAVDLLAGIAAGMGWDRLQVQGITSYHDTDYAAQGRAAIEAVTTLGYDIVCCHVESPDEAAHQADHATKVAGLESIDRYVVGPVLERLEAWRDAGIAGRVLVMPDHYTLVETRKHDATPVPFLLAGHGVASGGASRFTEAEAERAGVMLERGHEIMDLLIKGRCSGGWSLESD